MKQQLLALGCLTAFGIASCSKEAVSVTSNVTDKPASGKISTQFTAADSAATWYGSYAGYYGPYSLVAESDFIHDGVATDPYIDQPFSFSNVSLDIPPAYNISGDSIIFEVVAKNPVESGSYNYDIVLQIAGEEHSAELHFVSTANSRQYDQYYVGNKFVTNIPELVRSFENFKTIRLAFRNNATAASINDNPVYGFKYGEANRIGRIKTINVAGKGIAFVDNIRLLNSKNNKPVLSEDFNGNGVSHTIFY